MKFNTELLTKGGIASVYGICGVFVVLILFYIMTRVLMSIALKNEKKDKK